jgi:hypothetical protein
VNVERVRGKECGKEGRSPDRGVFILTHSPPVRVFGCVRGGHVLLKIRGGSRSQLSRFSQITESFFRCLLHACTRVRQLQQPRASAPTTHLNLNTISYPSLAIHIPHSAMPLIRHRHISLNSPSLQIRDLTNIFTNDSIRTSF